LRGFSRKNIQRNFAHFGRRTPEKIKQTPIFLTRFQSCGCICVAAANLAEIRTKCAGSANCAAGFLPGPTELKVLQRFGRPRGRTE